MANRSVLIINAKVPGYNGLQQIQVDKDGRLEAIQPMVDGTAPSIPCLDVNGDWLSPAGTDLQINGALGLAFPDLTLNHHTRLVSIAQFLAEQGVAGFLPTLVTTSVERIQQALEAIARFNASAARRSSPDMAQILGVHLEGPFLNPQKRGAHPAEHLLPLTLDQVKRVLGDYAEVVKIVTLAPELDDTETVIPWLKSLGITVSLGHSQATAAQAQAAFHQGASMVTHAFNAMPGLHHREPGLLGAALAHPTVSCGLIADGQHVCPTMLDILVRTGRGAIAPPSGGLFLVSDALAPLGLPDGVYPWDTRQIEVRNGTARLADGTLAGTTLPLLVGAQNLVRWGICTADEAIALATLAPRRAIGLPEWAIGQIVPLLRWHLTEATQALTWQRFDPRQTN
ncbi:N-acetylglucosamine-6-phosphate deacetylase [Oculatella sp. LEGE 06141]|uniref:N-acetylglucosamine-6-phosphate deacetylase n=1 Tax=Oculatella sp. LEGE 06141 TaxID=1828648 RepID=UPI001880888A|nr:N-acetylglucosamine-6-phosphate deacetylase [Oculatella sp. LEGE 06141]MBE9178059.1 N-acetylglucosamine-6-phosphate deacetylase [Oculatella sp. LEGE 06141]